MDRNAELAELLTALAGFEPIKQELIRRREEKLRKLLREKLTVEEIYGLRAVVNELDELIGLKDAAERESVMLRTPLKGPHR